jgi:hypothetical protein
MDQGRREVYAASALLSCGGLILANALVGGQAEIPPVVMAMAGRTGSGTGLIHRALVHHLTVIHRQVTDVHRFAPGHRRHVELLDAVQVCERERQAFPFRGTNELVDINRMDGLIARVIATTVAKGLPASGETCEEDIRHALPLLRGHPVPLWQPRPEHCGCWRLDQQGSGVGRCARQPHPLRRGLRHSSTRRCVRRFWPGRGPGPLYGSDRPSPSRPRGSWRSRGWP